MAFSSSNRSALSMAMRVGRKLGIPLKMGLAAKCLLVWRMPIWQTALWVVVLVLLASALIAALRFAATRMHAHDRSGF